MKTNESGAILIMLLVMIVILGLGSVMAGRTWRTTSQMAREKELFWRGDQYRMAIASYYSHGHDGSQGLFPSKLKDLVLDPRSPGVMRHIRDLYNDPMTREDWELIKDPSGKIMGVHSRSQLEPFKKDGFPDVYDNFSGKKSYSEWEFMFVPNRNQQGASDDVQQSR